jgi:hypothetical protein
MKIVYTAFEKYLLKGNFLVFKLIYENNLKFRRFK